MAKKKIKVGMMPEHKQRLEDDIRNTYDTNLNMTLKELSDQYGKPIHELKRILMDPKQPQFHYVDKYGKPIVN